MLHQPLKALQLQVYQVRYCCVASYMYISIYYMANDIFLFIEHGGILNSIAQDLLDVDMDNLLPYLLLHNLVNCDEEHDLSSILHSSAKKSKMLLEYLKDKEQGSLQKFLCSLNSAHDHTGHKGIADKLKQTMQANGIDCDNFCLDCCNRS